MNDWVIVAITLFLSALCSGLEIAFNSTNRLQLEVDLKKNKFSAKVVSMFFRNQSFFITSLLIGNNICNIIYGIAMARILRPVAVWMLPSSLEVEMVILLIQSILGTLLVLVVAEFLPKILFRINPNAILSFFAFPMVVCYYLLYPLTLIYSGIAALIIRVFFRMKMDQQEYKISTVDFDDYITGVADQSEADEDLQQEIQLFQSAMDFRMVKLRECMAPRNEIESVKLTDDLQVLKDRFEETKHSKLIVYSENIDNIVGYVHLNDVVEALAHGKTITAADIVRTVDFFPETYTADRLLKHFIQKHQGIAVVVDEFGGTSGIVSMEDVIEEIFGEIEDEYDEEDETEQVLKEDSYVFSARLEIDYLNETYDLDLPVSDDYETLAGMILHYYENIPEVGDELTIGHYRVKVLKATDMKLEEVELKRIH